RRPRLTIDQILAWADAHYAATGEWPQLRSGRVRGSPFDDSWAALNSALQKGLRGLPGGLSLAQLLSQRRGVWPPLTVERILAWADEHYAATGRWPVEDSGPVAAAPEEDWGAISGALAKGHRGLPGGTSLARLLAQQRGKRNPKALPRLVLKQILAW